MYAKIKRWYELGVWDKRKVRDAVSRNVITPEQYREITGETYSG